MGNILSDFTSSGKDSPKQISRAITTIKKQAAINELAGPDMASIVFAGMISLELMKLRKDMEDGR